MTLATTKLDNCSKPSCPREKVLDIPDLVDQEDIPDPEDQDQVLMDHHPNQDPEVIETISRILSFYSSELRSWLIGSSPDTSLFLRRLPWLSPEDHNAQSAPTPPLTVDLPPLLHQPPPRLLPLQTRKLPHPRPSRRRHQQLQARVRLLRPRLLKLLLPKANRPDRPDPDHSRANRTASLLLPDQSASIPSPFSMRGRTDSPPESLSALTNSPTFLSSWRMM